MENRVVEFTGIAAAFGFISFFPPMRPAGKGERLLLRIPGVGLGFGAAF